MNKLYGTRLVDFLFISEFGLENSCQAFCWINRAGISFILSSLGAYGGTSSGERDHLSDKSKYDELEVQTGS